MHKQGAGPLKFVRCLKNDGYNASLERNKIYQSMDDSDAAAHGMLRIIDESEEDYLYPADWFVPVPASEVVHHGSP
jgi:hypothetical protein